ncbi:MAG: hypothetical protein KDE35_11150 [Geminicoccaceae bacterium]|nr:hypothetical protein [Geminicoccaceae bacterium]
MEPFSKETYQKIVQEGYRLLSEAYGNTQADVQKKMATLGFEVSKPTLSNIINESKPAGKKLRIAGEAMLAIVKAELGYSFDAESLLFDETSRPAGWKQEVIPTGGQAGKDSILFHAEGRLPVPDKVAFLEKAEQEIIEFGVRLNAFADYFLTRSAHEFRNHIEKLMEKGVNLKLYLLDPDSNAARLYFEDRSAVQPEEARSCEVIGEAIKRLERIRSELAARNYSGKLEVFKYKHLPYCHFLITDGGTRHGNMMVSPYLYGIRRADCPVIQLTRNANPNLYRRYWNSFQQLTKDARPVFP